MSTEINSPAVPKWMFWTGWVLGVLPCLLFVFSAVMKFMKPPEVIEGMGKSGWPLELLNPLGVVEIVCTILYLIPQTAVLGAILLTGYMGGAIAMHVRIGEGFIPQIVIGIALWLGLYFRDPRLRSLIPFRTAI